MAEHASTPTRTDLLGRRAGRARLRRRRRHDRLQPDSRADRRRTAPHSSGSRSAITCCSAATTSTWRWPRSSSAEWPRSRPSLRLAITQRSALRRLCSAAKERMLGPTAPPRVAITILGPGRAVIGAAITTDLTLEDVERTFAEFLPIDRPGRFASPRDRRAGLRELGLPYETDPAITRHLASFLARSAAALPGQSSRRHATIGGRRMVRPGSSILFNGGFFTPQMARDRVAQALGGMVWRAAPMLRTNHLEAAVASAPPPTPAAGRDVGPPAPLDDSRLGRAPRAIGQGGQRPRVLRRSSCAAARTTRSPAVCVLARGTEEGTVIAHRAPFHHRRPTARSRSRSTAPRSDPTAPATSCRCDPTKTRTSTHRSSPCCATGASRGRSNCRCACRSPLPRSGRSSSGANRRSAITAGACSSSCGEQAAGLDDGSGRPPSTSATLAGSARRRLTSPRPSWREDRDRGRHAGRSDWCSSRRAPRSRPNSWWRISSAFSAMARRRGRSSSCADSRTA